MSALDDAALAALWTVSDQSGVRPEYLVPVLGYESGLDPSRPNAAGFPYYGIGQSSSSTLARLGISPAEFLAMPAAQQIALAVGPYFASVVHTYGPVRSATRAYQANLLPATLATARGLSQIVSVRGSASYNANAQLDPFHRGAITVADLAFIMAREVRAPNVAQAIARAYVLRPTERMQSPVYGQDFFDPLTGAIATALASLAPLVSG